MQKARTLQYDKVLRVNVGRNSEGVYFSIFTLSKDLLHRLIPGIHLVPSLFVARATASDYQQLEVPLLQHAIQLLTGLSLDRLRELGFPIVFVDTHPAYEPVIARLDLTGAPASPASDSGARREAHPTRRRSPRASRDHARM